MPVELALQVLPTAPSVSTVGMPGLSDAARPAQGGRRTESGSLSGRHIGLLEPAPFKS